MAFIAGHRKTGGLMLPMSVRDNLSLAAIEQFSRFGLIDLRSVQTAIDRIIQLLQIRCDGIESPAGTLSGGNQQKVVIGKWLMTKRGIILLNDPPRGADEGAAILFYSTDYDELVGCCDRVLVFYDGAVVRVLEGAAITERELVASALNLSSASAPLTEPAAMAPAGNQSSAAHPETAPQQRADGHRNSDLKFFISAHRGVLFAIAIFIAMFTLYTSKHPAGFSAKVVNTAATKGTLLALVAMAQTIPVLTAGLDLSVGMVLVLANCIASNILVGSPLQTTFGALAVLAVG